MNFIEFQWLRDGQDLKKELQGLLGSSGQLLKKHYSSKDLSRIIRSREISKLPLDLVNHMKINPIYDGPEVMILKETADYLAIHKPSGVHSHPLFYSDQDTVLNFLAGKGIVDPLKVNEDHYDRGLLYRLDFETSGVLLLAKNNSFFSAIRNEFQSQMKRKLYWVVVEGSFNKEGKWTHYFKASGAKGSIQKVFIDPQKDAHEGSFTVVKILEKDQKSLLLVDLKSGLRHQIRAQLAALGFPILGDEHYGGTRSDRLFLHAWRYEFTDEVEDINADLFERFFDLNRALQMSHDVLNRI